MEARGVSFAVIEATYDRIFYIFVQRSLWPLNYRNFTAFLWNHFFFYFKPFSLLVSFSHLLNSVFVHEKHFSIFLLFLSCNWVHFLHANWHMKVFPVQRWESKDTREWKLLLVVKKVRKREREREKERKKKSLCSIAPWGLRIMKAEQNKATLWWRNSFGIILSCFSGLSCWWHYIWHL